MIKVGDLRRGNKFSFYKPLINEPQQLTVKGYYFNDDDGLWYVQSDEYADINMAGLMPVPLTPEWLEKCGFVADRNGWHMPGSRLSLTDQFYPCWFDRMLWPQDIPDFKHLSLKYLHQLQNLYYALTGEELMITL